MQHQQKITPAPLGTVENNSSLMGSSLGFNRRLKIASQRPSSRGATVGEIFPANPEGLQANPYALQLFNLYQDETTLGSTLKAELQNLQEKINQMDLDKRIRGADPKQEFRQLGLRKWLQANANVQAKSLIEQRLSQQIEVPKLLEILNVNQAEEGLVKLYRLISFLECMILKVTEFEAVHLIKYDETYCKLCDGSQGAELGQVQLIKFPVSMVNLARCEAFIQIAFKQQQLISTKKEDLSKQADQQDLDFYIKKLKQEQANLQIQIKQKDEQIAQLNQQIKKLGLASSPQQESVPKQEQLEKQLQQQLRAEFESEFKQLKLQKDAEIQELVSQFQELLKQKEQAAQEFSYKEQEGLKQIQSSFQDKLERQKIIYEQKLKEQQAYYEEKIASLPKVPSGSREKDPSFYQAQLDKMSEEYANRIKSLEQESLGLRMKLTESQITIDNLREELKNLKEQLDQLVSTNQQIYEKFQKKYISKEDFSNSYEAALKLEFDIMKKSFETRISALQQTIDKLKRENSKAVNELKIQLERELETKKLLMNKLNLYS